MQTIKQVDHYRHTDGTTYQLGKLIDTAGADYDLTVIMNWPDTFDEDDCVKIVDFYFGEPYDEFNKQYVEQFIERQNNFKMLEQKLIDLKAAVPDDTDIDEYIDFVRSQVVKLY